MTLKGGTGFFAGQVVNLWVSNLYAKGIGSITIDNPRNFGMRFNPDPYGQPDYEALGIDPEKSKGTLNLVAKKFRYPVAFRSSLSLLIDLKDYWSIALEGIWTLNQHETIFRNVNIMPPIGRSVAPGSRDVYSTDAGPRLIPIGAAGSNPYNSVILMTNNEGRKGYAGNFGLKISRQAPAWQFQASYAYGFSRLYTEVTGFNASMSGQWASVETINGRNRAGLSVSDYDLGHRIFGMITKTFRWPGGVSETMFTLVYNGQSGTPFSFVNKRSIVNDNGREAGYDLAYIPTARDLETMSFVPIPGESITPAEQKAALEQFIESDPYLRAHRGAFAARNGSRLPFFHTLDLRLQQDFRVQGKSHSLRLSAILDIFNVLNLLNHNWGWQYFASEDQVALLTFAGYNNPATLSPNYQFKPYTGNPYTLQGSSQPGNSARWQAQLGFRVSLE
jgi:hypothetical protein